MTLPPAEFCLPNCPSVLGKCWTVCRVFLDLIWVLFWIRDWPEVSTLPFGDWYLDFGNLSVRLKMFLLSLIVLRSASWFSSDVFA